MRDTLECINKNKFLERHILMDLHTFFTRILMSLYSNKWITYMYISLSHLESEHTVYIMHFAHTIDQKVDTRLLCELASI